MGDTLAPIETCCACYTLRCQPRTDLTSDEGTLPPLTRYVDSTHSLNHRIRQHQTGIGSRFTRTHPVLEDNGVEAVNLDYRATSEQVLRYENDTTIELMYKFMEQYSHPQAWRCVASGSYCKFDLRQPMPAALRQRLDAHPVTHGDDA